MFNFGDKVKDRISGYVGIVIANTEWFNGCVRVTVQSQKLAKDGKVADNQTFDIEQLELVKAAAVPVKRRPTGGPMDDRAALRRN